MSKIEISRELAELLYRALNGGGAQLSGMEHGAAFRELRAILAAPVVERQPVDDEQWWSVTPDGDSALVTRAVRLTEMTEKIKSLCSHPSLSFHQVALLEGVLSDSSEPREDTAPTLAADALERLLALEPNAELYQRWQGLRAEPRRKLQISSCGGGWFGRFMTDTDGPMFGHPYAAADWAERNGFDWDVLGGTDQRARLAAWRAGK